MNKKNIITALFVFACTIANAQSSYDKIKMGILISPQVSWLKSDNETTSSNSSQFGYNFGLMLDRFFTANYAFTTGLTINNNGGSLTYNNNQVDKETVKYNLTYLEVPLAIKLKSNNNNRYVFNGQFGLSNLFNVDAKDGNGKSISDDINFYQLGYHFGGGVDIGLGSDMAIMIGIIYHRGLTDITSKDRYPDNMVQMNRLVIQTGILF